MAIADYIPEMTSISDFNHGKASKSFSKVRSNRPLLVLKRNKPLYAVQTVEDFKESKEIEENYHLLLLALERMQDFDAGGAIGRSDLLKRYSISQDELDALEEVEFE